MKLNYKRTIFVGFAFFLICAFWQAYDNTVPLILTNKFGMSQTLSGGVMTLDNVLALFMLPLFGAISDRCRSKRGRRTPFILVGTIIAAVFFVALSFADMAQLKNITEVKAIDDPAALSVIYNAEKDAELKTPDNESFRLGELFTEEEFRSIPSQLWLDAEAELTTSTGKTVKFSEIKTKAEFAKLPADILLPGDGGTIGEALREPKITEQWYQLVFSGGAVRAWTVQDKAPGAVYPMQDRFLAEGAESEANAILLHAPGKAFVNPHYTDYVVPARQAYAWSVTKANSSPLVAFMILLLIVLVAMSTFRSPAVALMPDVTVKPLRSKANAVINLMGSAGGILVLGLGMLFATGAVQNALMGYTLFFCVIAGIMLLALLIFLRTVKEPQFAAEMAEDSKRYGIEEAEEELSGSRKLSGAERKSLFFLLLSIILWFMGYNAITSKYSVYASTVLHKDYNLTLMIAQAAAIAAYLPVGLLSSKIGRKKMILAGVVMLTSSFTVASFLRESSPTVLMNAMFILAGVGWATINVNSFPMVVEMSKGSNVGKYTGIYYTASMAAQTVTPWISGFFMDKFGMMTFFPYAAIFAGFAFVTMLFVRHGDNKPIAKKGLEALDVEE
ncbi:MAG: MFS transporter [Oscillospiraceae bacterium]|nr:MFS transporter [Oscillospiraceae bacterium]